ncbi:MAG: hypothetical protein AAFR13_03520, partial [Pseudomonadota bacterium]
NHFDCSFEVFSDAQAVDAILQAVAASGAEDVIAPYTPTGHGRPHMMKLAALLRSQGIGFYEVRRGWDNRAWPYATKGFFPFKEKIPSLLIEAGLDVKSKRR